MNYITCERNYERGIMRDYAVGMMRLQMLLLSLLCSSGLLLRRIQIWDFGG